MKRRCKHRRVTLAFPAAFSTASNRNTFHPINISHARNNLDFSVQCSLHLSDFKTKLKWLDRCQRKFPVYSETVQLCSVQTCGRTWRRMDGTLLKTLHRVTKPAKNGDDIYSCF